MTDLPVAIETLDMKLVFNPDLPQGDTKLVSRDYIVSLHVYLRSMLCASSAL